MLNAVKSRKAPSTQEEEEEEEEVEAFKTFWSSYPRKVAKAKAVKAWAKLSPSKELRQTIMAALEVHKKSPDWLKDGVRFIPHPASWINGRRWEDEVSNNGFLGPVEIQGIKLHRGHLEKKVYDLYGNAGIIKNWHDSDRTVEVYFFERKHKRPVKATDLFWTKGLGNPEMTKQIAGQLKGKP